MTPGTYGSDSDSGSESTDELEEFLFKRKRGFCEHFASSYAYLARLLGIPSRVIVGFHGGEYNTLGDFWKVSTQDAHAWVEVYVQNHWQRQDPTVWIDGFAIQTSNQEFLGFGFLSHKNRQKYALLGRFIDWLSSTLDFINYRWTNFLIEFDSGVQAGLLVRGKTFLKSMGSWWVWTLILGMLGSALRLRRGLAIGKGKPQPQGLFDPVLNELSMWFDMHLGSPRLKGETPLHYIERVRQRLLLELDKVELNKKSPLETTQKSIQNSLSVSDLKNLKKLKDEFLPFLSIELDEVLYAKRSSQYTATAYRKLFVSKSKFVIK